MESYLFTSSLRDFLRVRRLAVWLVVAVAIYFVGHQVLRLNTEQSMADGYVTLSSSLVFRLLPLASAIFSMAVVAQEVEQKTIVYQLTRPISRWKLLFLRTLAAAVVVFIVSLLAAFMASFAAYGKPWNPLMARDVAALAVGSLAYTSLFVLVSLLLNRAMIVCLLFAFGWEVSIPNMPGDLYWLSVSSYLTSIAQRPTSSNGANGLLDVLGGMLGTNTIAPTTAWAILAAMCTVCLVFSAMWFTRNEYVPREDAE